MRVERPGRRPAAQPAARPAGQPAEPAAAVRERAAGLQGPRRERAGRQPTSATSGAAGFITVNANRTSAGDVIAGDVFVEKGREILTGRVTAVDVDRRHLRAQRSAAPARWSGSTTRPAGTRCRAAPGCRAGARNCSPDPRFTLDPDNYTNAFSTGYPFCLPSTTARTFTDTLDVNGNGNTSEQLTAQALADGIGDLLCPDGNRNADNVALDSRRLAPLQVGDPSRSAATSRRSAGRGSSPRTPPRSGSRSRPTKGRPAGLHDARRDVHRRAGLPAAAHPRPVHRRDHRGRLRRPPLLGPARPGRQQRRTSSSSAPSLGCENVAGAGTCRRVLGPNTFRDPARHPDADERRQEPQARRLPAAAATTRGSATAPAPRAVRRPRSSPSCRRCRTRSRPVPAASSPTPRRPQDASTCRARARPTGSSCSRWASAWAASRRRPSPRSTSTSSSTPTSFDGIPWNLDRRLSPERLRRRLREHAAAARPVPVLGLRPAHPGRHRRRGVRRPALHAQRAHAA